MNEGAVGIDASIFEVASNDAAEGGSIAVLTVKTDTDCNRTTPEPLAAANMEKLHLCED